MKRLLFIIILVIFNSIFYSQERNRIVISGSDTMLHLVERLSEKFEDESDVDFQIYGGGTAKGIENLLNNEIDICTASRNLTSSEAKQLSDYYKSIGIYYLIAKDAVCVYINKNNSNPDFTKEELAEIFSGKVNKWSAFDGSSSLIKKAIRNKNSGTRKVFSDFILDSLTFSSDCKELETTTEIAEFVSNNKSAIGFGGLGHKNKNMKYASIEGVYPTKQNLISDKYPLTRYLHFYTTNKPNGNVKKFIDWVLSPKGQQIIKEEGFIPLWEINY